MRPASEVALFFLHRIDREVGETISPKKLQKLLYYTQVWSLVLRNQPCFPEDLEAWVHGPVVRAVWEEYRGHRFEAIPQPQLAMPDFSGAEQEVLAFVFERYGELSANHLEQLTHAEAPWKRARQGLAAHELSRNVIDLEQMREFYASHSAWGKFSIQKQEEPFQALAYGLLCRSETFVGDLSLELTGLKNALLDAIEREHPSYQRELRDALEGAFTADEPAMTADEFGDWFAAI